MPLYTKTFASFSFTRSPRPGLEVVGLSAVGHHDGNGNGVSADGFGELFHGAEGNDHRDFPLTAGGRLFSAAGGEGQGGKEEGDFFFEMGFHGRSTCFTKMVERSRKAAVRAVTPPGAAPMK